jgi:hypothetical protein
MDKISRLVETTDMIRQAFPDPTQSSWSKEWHHFCVIGEGVEVILNLNLCGDNRPAARPGEGLARLVLLAQAGEWYGDVETFPTRDVLVRAGKVDLRFGHNWIRFKDGEFELSAALQNQPVSLHLQLRPAAYPLLMRSNTPIGAGQINWLVLPRLLASGTIIIGKQVFKLEGAPAYHDHNWGKWLWGHDFAWEWGFGLPLQPATPWSLVFDLTTNRRRTTTLELTLALWKGPRLERIFTQRDISIRRSGFLQQRPLLKVPRVMSLISPEQTSEVPLRLELEAVKGSDRLEVSFEAQSVAQIAIPNETDLGVTLINEVSGIVTVQGQVKGESVQFQGPGIFELLT